MTVNQVKDAEQASKDLILKNDPVYAKEANLATAKTIKGLRAVFEETYPDPVRIVSVGKKCFIDAYQWNRFNRLVSKQVSLWSS